MWWNNVKRRWKNNESKTTNKTTKMTLKTTTTALVITTKINRKKTHRIWEYRLHMQCIRYGVVIQTEREKQRELTRQLPK